MNRKWIAASGVVTLLALVTGGVIAWTSVEADPASDSVVNAARTAVALGDQDEIVAYVDGDPVRLGSVAGYLAAAQFPGISDGTGRTGEGLTPEEALDRLLEPRLLAAMATREGFAVSEDDVTLFIRSGYIAPLESGALSEEQKEMSRVFLELAGATPETALTNENVRSSVRTSLLAGRYESAHRDTPRDQLLADARTRIPVEIVPGAIDHLE